MEKDDAEVGGKVKAVQDAKVKIAKPGRRNLKAEAERTRGARADGIPPPTNQRPRWKQQSQPTVEEQGQIQQQGGGGGLTQAVCGAGGRWKKQLSRQERVKKLHQDLRIDQNKMLKNKPELRQRLKDLVDKFEDVFVTPNRTVGMVPNRYKTHICLKPGAKPKKQNLRQLHPQQLEDLQAQLDDWLREGVIRLSTSPWLSLLVPVKKKDGRTRWCINYREVNAQMVGDSYPTPHHGGHHL